MDREFLLQLLLHPSSAVSPRLLLDLLQLVSMTSRTLSVFIQGLLLAKLHLVLTGKVLSDVPEPQRTSTF